MFQRNVHNFGGKIFRPKEEKSSFEKKSKICIVSKLEMPKIRSSQMRSRQVHGVICDGTTITLCASNSETMHVLNFFKYIYIFGVTSLPLNLWPPLVHYAILLKLPVYQFWTVRWLVLSMYLDFFFYFSVIEIALVFNGV